MSSPDPTSSSPAVARSLAARLAVAALALAIAVAAAPFLLRGAVFASSADHSARQHGRAAFAIVAPRSVRQDLLAALTKAADAGGAIRDGVPVIALAGSLTRGDAASGDTTDVTVYGVDERFWRFMGLPGEAPTGDHLVMAAGAATTPGAATGQAVRLRVTYGEDAPLASLHGRRTDITRTLDGVVDVRESAALEGLSPLASPLTGAAASQVLFVPLARLEEDPAWKGRANALLVASASDDGGAQAAALARLVATQLTLADYGLSLRDDDHANAVTIESRSGTLDDAVVDALSKAAIDAGGLPTPVLTMLVRRLAHDGREVAYPFVSSLELQAVAPDVHAEELSRPPIVLNEWTARRLGVTVGDTVGMEYFAIHPGGAPAVDSGEFEVAGVLPMSGLALQPGLTPDLPGITGAPVLSDWAPRLPFEASRINDEDRDYWSRYGATPKAFVPPQVGRALWRTGVMAATSVQVSPPEQLSLADTRAQLETRLLAQLSPALVGIHVRPLEQDGLDRAASAAKLTTVLTWWGLPLVLAAWLLSTALARPAALTVGQAAGHAAVAIALGGALAIAFALVLFALWPASTHGVVACCPALSLAPTATAGAFGLALALAAAGAAAWVGLSPRVPAGSTAWASALLVIVALALAGTWLRAHASSASGPVRLEASGGYQLFVRSVAPVFDLERLAADGPLQGQVAAFRVHEAATAESEITAGPADVRLVSVTSTFIDQGRFAFDGSLDRTDEERANPWLLLRREQRDASDPGAAEPGSPIVPAIATPGMLRRLQRSLGEDVTVAIDGRPLRLRIVATLREAIGGAFLGDALFLNEADFTAWLPRTAGPTWLAFGDLNDPTAARAALLTRLAVAGARATIVE